MRFVAGTGGYPAGDPFDPMVVFDVDPDWHVTQVWPYDGHDDTHRQLASYLAAQLGEPHGASLNPGQFTRMLLAGGVYMQWDEFEQDVLVHPEGPWHAG